MDRIMNALEMMMEASGRLEAATEMLEQEMGMEGAVPYVVNRDVLLSWGHGWYEVYTIGDEDDPPVRMLYECVWLNGYVMTADVDGNIDYPNWLKQWYGKKGGARIWSGKPTEQLMEATPWTD